MTAKYCGGRVPDEPAATGPLAAAAARAAADTAAAVERIAPHAALTAIWGLVDQANKHIDDEKPWALAKDPAAAARLGRCLRGCLEALRATAVLLWPFLPATAERMWHDLGLDGTPAAVVPAAGDLLPAGTQLRPSGSLFPRIVE
jgi:methionyl-tRNA synthetase